jgi:hypothetical protein
MLRLNSPFAGERAKVAELSRGITGTLRESFDS